MRNRYLLIMIKSASPHICIFEMLQTLKMFEGKVFILDKTECLTVHLLDRPSPQVSLK